MPVVRTVLDILDVLPLLSARGYGVNRNQRYGLQLTVATSRQFSNGSFERELLKPISKEDLGAILTRCESKEQAALMIENISLGKIHSAVEETQETTAATGLTAEQIAHIIDSRVASKVTEAIGPTLRELTAMRDELVSTLKAAESLLGRAEKQAKPTAAPKKGAATKPKPGKKLSDAEVEAIVKDMNLPTEPPPAAA